MATHVFILGAGASLAAGAPLMNNFMDEAERILEESYVISNEARAFRNVFASIERLTVLPAKFDIDLLNIESVCGLFEIGALLGLSEQGGSNFKTLAGDLRVLISKTIAGTIAHQRQIANPPIGYQHLAKIVKKLRSRGDEVVFVTFNYDLCLEHTILSLGCEYAYMGDGGPNSIPLYKLHGSLSWSYESLGAVNSRPDIILGELFIDEQKFLRTKGNSQILDPETACNFGSLSSKYDPVIIPPSLSKVAQYPVMQDVWRFAAKALKRAKHIYCIGYSMPVSDNFFPAFLGLATMGPSRIKTFVVIDPDVTRIRERYAGLMGNTIRDKFNFMPHTFSEGCRLLLPNI